MIATVVLAAGASSRMGRSKILLEVGGASLLRRAARCAVEAELGPVVVALGADAELGRAEITGLACTIVADPALARRGMNATLAAALAVVPAASRAAVVLLADMPLVTPDAIRALVARYRASSAPLVATRYGDVLAPPVLYDRALFHELACGGPGDGIGRALLRRYRDRAEVVDAEPDVLVDVDEPSELDRVRARLSPGGAT